MITVENIASITTEKKDWTLVLKDHNNARMPLI